MVFAISRGEEVPTYLPIVLCLILVEEGVEAGMLDAVAFHRKSADEFPDFHARFEHVQFECPSGVRVDVPAGSALVERGARQQGGHDLTTPTLAACVGLGGFFGGLDFQIHDHAERGVRVPHLP